MPSAWLSSARMSLAIRVRRLSLAEVASSSAPAEPWTFTRSWSLPMDTPAARGNRAGLDSGCPYKVKLLVRLFVWVARVQGKPGDWQLESKEKAARVQGLSTSGSKSPNQRQQESTTSPQVVARVQTGLGGRGRRRRERTTSRDAVHGEGNEPMRLAAVGPPPVRERP